jgi:hypothetical protein
MSNRLQQSEPFQSFKSIPSFIHIFCLGLLMPGWASPGFQTRKVQQKLAQVIIFLQSNL